MIKQLYKQIVKKRRGYYLSSIILFLSFFVLVIILSVVYPRLIITTSLKVPVKKDNRLEFFIRWKSVDEETNKDIKSQIKQGILKLQGVQAADYVVNDIGSVRTSHSYDVLENSAYFMLCGGDFAKVFDLKLGEGTWFLDDDQITQSVVITRNHANYLGIQHLSPNQIYTAQMNNWQGAKVDYRVVGIVENMGNMRDVTSSEKVEKNVFPVFCNSKLINNPYSYEARLMIKMQDGYNFDKLNSQVLSLLEGLKAGQFISKHRLTTLDDVLKEQIIDHWRQMKVIYGILFMLATYIFVALFGNFWKMTQKRTVEIGIRRALGHTRGNVVFYILAESLLLLAMVLIPATLIYLNVYSVIKIAAPWAVYLISAGILLFIVLVATLIPAVRAGSIHPVQALAEE